MIFDLIDGILRELGVPFYFRHTEFPAGADPPLYIIYDLYDYPKLSGDGIEQVTTYVITFNIYGTDVENVETMYTNMLAILLDNSFVRAGASYGGEYDFPAYSRKTADFKYDYERND